MKCHLWASLPSGTYLRIVLEYDKMLCASYTSMFLSVLTTLLFFKGKVLILKFTHNPLGHISVCHKYTWGCFYLHFTNCIFSFLLTSTRHLNPVHSRWHVHEYSKKRVADILPHINQTFYWTPWSFDFKIQSLEVHQKKIQPFQSRHFLLFSKGFWHKVQSELLLGKCGCVF